MDLGTPYLWRPQGNYPNIDPTTPTSSVKNIPPHLPILHIMDVHLLIFATLRKFFCLNCILLHFFTNLSMGLRAHCAKHRNFTNFHTRKFLYSMQSHEVVIFKIRQTFRIKNSNAYFIGKCSWGNYFVDFVLLCDTKSTQN